MPDAALDPASLDRLHDIVVPSPVSMWWPPAPGWWVLGGIVALAVIWFCLRWWKSRRASSYRRTALRELAQMKDIHRLTELLKRTALAAYPRETVAPLTGDKWLAFLNESAPDGLFQGDTGERLKTLQYSPYALRWQEKKDDLLSAVRNWIKTHKGLKEEKGRN